MITGYDRPADGAGTAIYYSELRDNFRQKEQDNGILLEILKEL